MKKSLLSIILLAFAPFLIKAQCDSLLIDNASIDPFCENEWVNLDLSTFEYRKGGNWITDNTNNIKKNNLRGIFSENFYIYYTYTNPKKTCTATDSIFIKINKKPEIKFVFNSSTICYKQIYSLKFIATPIGGTWYDTASTLNLVVNNQFLSSNTFDSANTNVYPIFYAYEEPITNCSDTLEFSITVKPFPKNPLKTKEILFSVKDTLLDLADFLIDEYPDFWQGDGVLYDNKNDKYYFSNEIMNFEKGSYTLSHLYEDHSGSPPYCSRRSFVKVIVVESINNTPATLPIKPTTKIYPNPSSGQVQI